MTDVVGDVAKIEAGLLDHLQLGIVLERCDVGWAWMQRHLAFIALELLYTHRSVGVDRENQLVEFDLTRIPIVLVGGVADLRVFLIALEHVGSGADGVLVDVARIASLEQLLGVLGGEDRGEAHGDILDERGVDAVEGHDHGQRPGLFDLGDILVQAHPVEVGELGGVGLAERMLGIEHAVEGEQHVIGIEITMRREVFGGVELYPFAQVEGVDQAIRRDIPAFGQRRCDGGLAPDEFHQPVVDRLGGVVVGSGGVLRGVEPGRAALGAEHQAAGSLG